MSMRSAVIVAAALAFVGLAPTAGFADLVTFAFSGALDDMTAFDGTYTFNSETDDVDPSGMTGVFEGALTAFTLDMGAVAFESTDVNMSAIRVFDDGADDTYVVEVVAESSNASLSFTMALVFGDVFGNDALPLFAPSPALFAETNVFGEYASTEGGFLFDGGDVNSLESITVPAPGAAALGAIGLLMAGWFGRRS